MKKILILFLAIVIIGTGLGFGATSNSNTTDPGNITSIGPNTVENNANSGQNDVNDRNDRNNGQESNWYNGFWDDKDMDNGFWKDKKDFDKDNNDQFEIEVNNYITTIATGGNAESAGGDAEATTGDAESNVEVKFASGQKCAQIKEEIEGSIGENVFISGEIPMQKTGVPIVPVLLSALLIGSGLLCRKLRN